MPLISTTSGTETSEILYTDIEQTAGGITHFAVDGRPLEDRMTLLGEPVTNGAGIRVSEALLYRSVSGNLYAWLGLENTSDNVYNPSSWDARYIDADRNQTTASQAWGANELASNARASLVLTFEGRSDATGGEIQLDGWVQNFQIEAPISLAFGQQRAMPLNGSATGNSSLQ